MLLHHIKGSHDVFSLNHLKTYCLISFDNFISKPSGYPICFNNNQSFLNHNISLYYLISISSTLMLPSSKIQTMAYLGAWGFRSEVRAPTVIIERFVSGSKYSLKKCISPDITDF